MAALIETDSHPPDEQPWQAFAESLPVGLAIVARVAETHEGSVTVENRPTGGAAFTLKLRPA